MDPFVIQQYLAQAEQHAAAASRLVARQEALVRQLERDGHDTSDAFKVLATLRDTQALHEQAVVRLQEELGVARR
ncbi:hypothetical protein XH89_20125 [Bradyrhizobium sp. CCBAU 53340]|nr:hypothetical protein XH89_20125 [Bradyrhizobium sp. CCBAU 53340]